MSDNLPVADLDGEILPDWLQTWPEVGKESWPDLLLGNGASIELDSRFSYPSLYDVACDEGHLNQADLALFDLTESANFEAVLERLDSATQVNNILGYSTPRVAERYQSIRRALLSAVNDVHPAFQDVSISKLVAANEFISKFERCFTTNYDLSLYWAIMQDDSKFIDFFWTNGTHFDDGNIEVYYRNQKKTRVLYLHGALMILPADPEYDLDDEYHVWKATANGRDLLSRITEAMANGGSPIFVSEGTARQKRESIARSRYLEFALSSLRASSAPLAVFGNSLQPADQHIIDGIKESERARVALSLHPLSRLHLDSERARLRKVLAPIRLSFFDSRTVPFWTSSEA